MNWTAKLVTHHAKPRIAVYFEKNADWIARIKKLEDARWSQTLKAWHVPDTDENRLRFKLDLPIVLSEIHLRKIEQFKRWLSSKRYSSNTIKTYSEALHTFLKYYHHKPIEQITNEDVIVFNNDYILKNNLSASFQNQVVNGVKLFFNEIQGAKLKVDLVHRPKKEKLLPNVLSKQEVKEILNAPNNIKHKAMLSLIYACGLRRSELLNLKPNDIDSNRGVIIIRQAKGKKDRIAPLSEKILAMLREYYKAYKPSTWLFEGQNINEKYDERSLASVLKRALEKTNISKPVTLHWLRHSYATHILEAGTDLRYIQELLGHKSSKTTEIYTHVSTKNIQNIKSPFDDLDL
jgi:integrase/recombinase XerD